MSAATTQSGRCRLASTTSLIGTPNSRSGLPSKSSRTGCTTCIMAVAPSHADLRLRKLEGKACDKSRAKGDSLILSYAWTSRLRQSRATLYIRDLAVALHESSRLYSELAHGRPSCWHCFACPWTPCTGKQLIRQRRTDFNAGPFVSTFL